MLKVFEMAPEIVSDDDSMEVFIVITKLQMPNQKKMDFNF